MWDKILFIANDFFNRLEPGHFEGMILYIIGSISVLYLEFRHRQDWAIGLKGDNGKWEAPEIVIRIWILIFPHFIMSSGFLQIKWPTEAWYFMIAVLGFVLLGRERLNQLISLRFGGNHLHSEGKPRTNETLPAPDNKSGTKLSDTQDKPTPI